MLEGITKAERTAIAERRKAALHKLGVFFDFKGEYLQKITRSQLEALGLLDDQARGSTSPEADIIKRTKSRVERAIGIGYESVKFAESLLAEEENEYDCESYDLLRAAHLPKPDRTRAEVKMGVSEASQVEHNAMRIVYLDFDSRKDLPDRFRYIDQPWLYMYRTEIYSEEEYIDYLGRNPHYNLLMSNTSRSTMLSAIFGTSRTPTWTRTKPMHWRRSSSQNVQKRRMRPSARPSKVLRTTRVLQRKALLTRLPEHHRKWKPPHP